MLSTLFLIALFCVPSIFFFLMCNYSNNPYPFILVGFILSVFHFFRQNCLCHLRVIRKILIKRWLRILSSARFQAWIMQSHPTFKLWYLLLHLILIYNFRFYFNFRNINAYILDYLFSFDPFLRMFFYTRAQVNLGFMILLLVTFLDFRWTELQYFICVIDS